MIFQTLCVTLAKISTNLHGCQSLQNRQQILRGRLLEHYFVIKHHISWKRMDIIGLDCAEDNGLQKIFSVLFYFFSKCRIALNTSWNFFILFYFNSYSNIRFQRKVCYDYANAVIFTSSSWMIYCSLFIRIVNDDMNKELHVTCRLVFLRRHCLYIRLIAQYFLWENYI